MSYEYKFLLDAILFHLQRTPYGLLGNLSRALGVSQRTIERTVFIASGKTFRDLRKEVLIERVTAVFVSFPARPIKRVAFDLGYNSPRSFARAVKRACGSSPQELRSRVIHDLLASHNA